MGFGRTLSQSAFASFAAVSAPLRIFSACSRLSRGRGGGRGASLPEEGWYAEPAGAGGALATALAALAEPFAGGAADAEGCADETGLGGGGAVVAPPHAAKAMRL